MLKNVSFRIFSLRNFKLNPNTRSWNCPNIATDHLVFIHPALLVEMNSWQILIQCISNQISKTNRTVNSIWYWHKINVSVKTTKCKHLYQQLFIQVCANMPSFRQVTHHTLANHLYVCSVQEHRITMTVEASWWIKLIWQKQEFHNL